MVYEMGAAFQEDLIVELVLTEEFWTLFCWRDRSPVVKVNMCRSCEFQLTSISSHQMLVASFV